MKLKKILFGEYEYYRKSKDGKLDMRINLQFGILPAIAIIALIILLNWLL